MNTITITITVDFTPENMAIINQLCYSPLTEAKVREALPIDKSIKSIEISTVKSRINTKMTELIGEGRSDIVEHVLAKFGVERLPQLAPEKYEAFLEELKNI